MSIHFACPSLKIVAILDTIICFGTRRVAMLICRYNLCLAGLAAQSSVIYCKCIDFDIVSVMIEIHE